MAQRLLAKEHAWKNGAEGNKGKQANIYNAKKTEHAFFNCHNIKIFWRDVKQFILTQKKTNMQIEINEQTVLFGLTQSEPKRKREKEQN